MTGTDEEYVLRMDSETASVVALACEFYFRVKIGQFEEIRHLTVWPKDHGDPTFAERIAQCNAGLAIARRAAFPGLNANTSYGIGYSRDADTAWNVYQAVRYVKAWHDHPEGGYTVNFDKPIKFTDAPMPRCEVRDGYTEEVAGSGRGGDLDQRQ